jgi:sugar transferase (PEP-CTERM system associated)
VWPAAQESPRIKDAAVSAIEIGQHPETQEQRGFTGFADVEDRVISVFRHYLPIATAIQLCADAALFFVAVILSVAVTNDRVWVSPYSAAMPALAFALVMLLSNGAFGLYRLAETNTYQALFTRVLLALGIGVSVAYIAFAVLPNGRAAQEAIWYLVLYTFAGMLFLRQVFHSRRAAQLLSRRVLVLGTGRDAKAVEEALAPANRAGIIVVGFYRVGSDPEVAVPAGRIVPEGASLADAVTRLSVDEVIVAVREQRGGVLPLRQLLDCRLDGVRITNLAGFFERVRGEVPIESVKASWLIYGEGFRKGRARAIVKRIFDVAMSSVLLALVLPVMALCALAILFEGGGPVIYRQERTGRGGAPFTLLKFRSMAVGAETGGKAQWAQANDARVTAVGRFIRRTRIDELPQLFNVLRGEMSFVGPRPERPCFVDELSKSIPFYGVRHSVKPGITGWAQVRYSYAASIEDTARKLRFDLYYVKNHSLFLDVVILLKTVRVVLLGEGAR